MDTEGTCMQTVDPDAAARLRQAADALGADLFGVADLTAAASTLPTNPADLFDRYSRAVVVGIKLPDGAVETCVTGPTPLYQHAYSLANQTLDELAFRLARVIEQEGYRALPLPASKLLDREDLSSNVSYKALGRLAGLGWQGKSLLLIHPDCGPRFRMAAVLTDMPVPSDQPVRNRCGSCTACQEACPAQAIKGVNTEDHYADREEALWFERCAEMCMEVFARRPHIEKPICGVCVRVCPWGQKGDERAS